MVLDYYIDLFSGIGGFRYALNQSGITAKWYGHSDINKYANRIYGYHFNDSVELGDISTIDCTRLQGRNGIITFGWPYENHYTTGRRKRQDGNNRSALLPFAINIIRAKKPLYFIAENNKGIFTIDNGSEIIKTIREISYLHEDVPQYDIQLQLLNSRSYLPHNRERVFIVGTLRDMPRREIFPFGPRKDEAERSDTRDKKRVVIISDSGQKRTPEIREEILPALRSSRNSGYGIKILKDDKPRRLSPIEYERLQGFPDNWTECGTHETLQSIVKISDHQRYRLTGDSTTVPVAQEIFNKISQWL